jgi:hypothetical protein
MISHFNGISPKGTITDETFNRTSLHRIPLVVVLVAYALRRTAG